MKITIIREFELSMGDIDDIMSTALEGGITYWCGEAIIHKVPEEHKDDIEFASEVISRDGELLLKDKETPESWILTKEKFSQGFKKFCEERAVNPDQVIEDCDADDADCIIQYALFNEIVFG